MNGNGLPPHDSGQPSESCVPQDALAGSASATTASPSPSQGVAPVRILVVEDDVPLARLLCSWLYAEGFTGDVAHDGDDALRKLLSEEYHLVLLDLNLPGMDGLTLMRKVHVEKPGLPILVLTGRSRTEDTVTSLNDGADDCLIKPFSLIELLARIRALLRRRSVAHGVEAPPKLSAGLHLNREEYRVERNGRRIELTPREFDLLEFLMQHAPKPVSRAMLMEEVWHVPFDPSTNIVDVYMKYLRDKVDAGDEEKLIRTVRGVGYALACA